MKKALILMLTAAILCAGLCACGAAPTETTVPLTRPTEEATQPPISGQPGEILAAIIEKAAQLDSSLSTMDTAIREVNSGTCEPVIGLCKEQYYGYVIKAVESAPKGSATAHSIAFIQLDEPVNTADYARRIISGTDPRRFGEQLPEEILCCYVGHYVILCASTESICEAVLSATRSLTSENVTRLDRANTWSDK